VYERACPFGWGIMKPVTTVFLPNGTPKPAVSPAQLARTAVAQLTVPEPTINRSPSAGTSDQGTPSTWVNLWTWFWTSPHTWRPLTRTARAAGVWARVTVRPDHLVLTPGDGSASVSCPGPGRPWRADDGDNPPSDGGCGYRYRHVTAKGPVTATLSIRWRVTWAGSGGAGGTLPTMTTSVSSRLAVQQIQAVVR
jgi:hypothetical protein